MTYQTPEFQHHATAHGSRTAAHLPAWSWSPASTPGVGCQPPRRELPEDYLGLNHLPLRKTELELIEMELESDFSSEELRDYETKRSRSLVNRKHLAHSVGSIPTPLPTNTSRFIPFTARDPLHSDSSKFEARRWTGLSTNQIILNKANMMCNTTDTSQWPKAVMHNHIGYALDHTI